MACNCIKQIFFKFENSELNKSLQNTITNVDRDFHLQGQIE